MNNKLTRFLIVLILLCCYVQAWTQETAKEGIESLSWMVGKWNITATLEGSDDSFVKESGFKECSWVLGNRVIRCDSFVRNDQHADKDDWQFRSVITYIAFDKTNAHYKITWIRSDGNHTSVVFNRAEDSTLQSKYTYQPPSLGFDMLINTTWTKVDTNHFTELEVLRSENDSFSERYELKAVRINK